MQKANTEKLLAEYMEKFGKKLNEQESRTGDELFMWLKDKLTTDTPAPQRELPEPLEELKEKVIHTLYVDLNHLDGSELLDELVDKSYQSGVEAERKRLFKAAQEYDVIHHTQRTAGGVVTNPLAYSLITEIDDILTNQGETK